MARRVGIFVGAIRFNPAVGSSLATAQDFVNAFFYADPKVFTSFGVLVASVYEGVQSRPRFLNVASLVDNDPNIKIGIFLSYALADPTEQAIIWNFIDQCAVHPSIGFIGMGWEHMSWDAPFNQPQGPGFSDPVQVGAKVDEFEAKVRSVGKEVLHYYLGSHVNITNRDSRLKMMFTNWPQSTDWWTVNWGTEPNFRAIATGIFEANHPLPEGPLYYTDPAVGRGVYGEWNIESVDWAITRGALNPEASRQYVLLTSEAYTTIGLALINPTRPAQHWNTLIWRQWVKTSMDKFPGTFVLPAGTVSPPPPPPSPPPPSPPPPPPPVGSFLVIIESTPIPVVFTVDTIQQSTPYSITLLTNSILNIGMPDTITMPQPTGLPLTFQFLHWSDGSVDPLRTVVVSSDISLSAVYALTNPPVPQGKVGLILMGAAAAALIGGVIFTVSAKKQ